MTLSNDHHAALHNALETAAAVMRERDVVALAGHAYFTDEAEAIQRGVEALGQYELNPTSHAARYRNENKVALAGKALDMADILLEERTGLQELKNKAWTDQDRQVIRAGLDAFRRATAYRRG